LQETGTGSVFSRIFSPPFYPLKPALPFHCIVVYPSIAYITLIDGKHIFYECFLWCFYQWFASKNTHIDEISRKKVHVPQMPMKSAFVDVLKKNLTICSVRATMILALGQAPKFGQTCGSFTNTYWPHIGQYVI
jgi:hypothetical protein